MTKSTTTKAEPAMALNFTKRGTSERGGSTACHYNAKLRRLSIPASRCKGVKSYEVMGADADALMLTPAEGGRAVHPSQRFITIPANIAEALKSTTYSIYEPTADDQVTLGEGVLVLLGEGVKIEAVLSPADEPAEEPAKKPAKK